MFIGGLILGLFIGSVMGFCLCAIFAVAANSCREMELDDTEGGAAR
jgi:hypothetical protein